MAHEIGPTNRAKHIDFKHHCIQEKVTTRDVRPYQMPPSQRLADIFTKPLRHILLTSNDKQINMHSPIIKGGVNYSRRHTLHSIVPTRVNHSCAWYLCTASYWQCKHSMCKHSYTCNCMSCCHRWKFFYSASVPLIMSKCGLRHCKSKRCLILRSKHQPPSSSTWGLQNVEFTSTLRRNAIPNWHFSLFVPVLDVFVHSVGIWIFM